MIIIKLFSRLDSDVHFRGMNITNVYYFNRVFLIKKSIAYSLHNNYCYPPSFPKIYH